MAQQILAPWAEVVPGAPYPMTVDDVLALPDDGWMYELIEGRLVRMPPSGSRASSTGLKLGAAILAYVSAHRLGDVTGADGGYVLNPARRRTTMLAPDVAFVRAEHVPPPDSPEYDRLAEVAPDLAAEVVSPNQWRPEMAAKARTYLRHGVRLVWIVWPRYAQVDVWRHGADEPAATLRPGDTLDGEDVLPGFTLPVSTLFA